MRVLGLAVLPGIIFWATAHAILLLMIGTRNGCASRSAETLLGNRRDGGKFDGDMEPSDAPLGHRDDAPPSEKDRSNLRNERSTGDRGLGVYHGVPLAGDSIESANRCSGLDLSTVEKGASCGAPFSAPCFDWDRCPSPSVYVYDSTVSIKIVPHPQMTHSPAHFIRKGCRACASSNFGSVSSSLLPICNLP